MIVVCHFLQAYGNQWAFVLNTGVQIFLLLSGYLYGIKGIINISYFYKRRLKKVYMPYLVWTFIAAICLFTFSFNTFSFKRFLSQLLLLGTMDGQTHLWFMPILFVCYLMLPVLELIKKEKLLIGVMIVLFLALLWGFMKTNNANLLWIMTYYIGYILGRWPVIMRFISLPVILLEAFMCVIIGPDDFLDRTFKGRFIHIFTALAFLILFSNAENVINKLLKAQAFTTPPYPPQKIITLTAPN